MNHLIIIAVLLQEGFAPTPRPAPTPFVPTVDIVELDSSAVAAMTALVGTKPAAVLTVYSPSWCPTCPQWKQRLGSGGNGVTLNWVAENPPVGYPGPVPAFYTSDGRYWDWGAGFKNSPSTAKLAEWAGVAVASTGPRTVGTINAKGFIDGFIAATKAFGGDVVTLDLSHQGKGWIDFGAAGIYLPTGCRAELRHSGTTSRLTFSGAKPRVRMLALDQPIDGVLYDGATVTVDFSGWMLPDARLTVR